MQQLSIELVEGSPPVLHVRGEIDLATAEQLGAALQDAVAAAPTVIVDLGAVTFIDVRGLRVILRAAESRNGLGPLMLVNADRVDWLLELVGLGKISSIVLCDGNDAHGG